MAVAAYFDESERDDGRAPICLAGYVFKPTAYKKFEVAWRRALLTSEGRRLRHFHMTDLYAGKGEYAGLGIPERVRLLDEAVDAINAHAFLGVAVHFDRDEFEEMAPPWWPYAFGSIYAAAGQMCLQVTAYRLKQQQCHMPVFYVFEGGHKWRAQLDAFLTAFGQDKEARRRLRYDRHMFGEKDREAGLQAADLLAWTITKLETGGAHHRSTAPFAPALLRLGSLDADRSHLNQFTGPLLKRLMDDMIAGLPQALTVPRGPRKVAFR